ncbi:MAG: hypothetical protein ACQEQ7_05545 [Thermodesulfobacteriota bacterium]
MRKMKLNSKLVFSSLAIVILVMVVTTIAVSIVINRQNSEAAYDRIENSMNVIRKDLQDKSDKILRDSQQAATLDGMGGKAKFLSDYKKGEDRSVTQNTFREVGSTLFNIASMSDVWELGVYDSDGDLKSFAVEIDDQTYAVGYLPGQSGAEARGLSRKRGEQIKTDAWKKLDSLPRISMKLTHEGQIPKAKSVHFEQMQGYMCLVSTAPIMAKEYDKKTDALVKKQFGYSVAVRKLGRDFLADMSALTGLEINIFTNDGLSIGDHKEYTALKSRDIIKQDGAWTLAGQDILLNDVQLEEGECFQGVLPLFGSAGKTGAIAALISKDVVQANTWQMIRLLGIIYLACILIMVPLTFVFSNSIAKPIGKIISGLTEGSDQVASAANQVSASSQSLAEGSSEQAASIEETSSSLEEMASMTQQNADNSAQANTLMTDANQVVNEANAEESASAAEQMSAQAAQLLNHVNQLAALVGRKAVQANTARSHPGQKRTVETKNTTVSPRTKVLAAPAKNGIPDDTHQGRARNS